MTGMPSSFAFFTAGRIASESLARMMRTFAPFEIRLSTSASCLVGFACASAEMYFAPDGARPCLIAASSVFHRSSWKFDQETPTTMSFAIAKLGTQMAARAAPVNNAFLMLAPPILESDSHRIDSIRFTVVFLCDRFTRSQIAVDQIFQILLPARVRLRIEFVALH